MASVALQLAGLILISVGLFVWFGTGPGLVGSGVLTTVAGVAAELTARRKAVA